MSTKHFSCGSGFGWLGGVAIWMIVVGAARLIGSFDVDATRAFNQPLLLIGIGALLLAWSRRMRQDRRPSRRGRALPEPAAERHDDPEAGQLAVPPRSPADAPR